MAFDWDNAKSRSNQSRHFVGFELASEVFDDPYVLTAFDRVVDGELRWHTTLLVAGVLLLLVVVTEREIQGEAVTRIISAKKGNHMKTNSTERSKSIERLVAMNLNGG